MLNLQERMYNYEVAPPDRIWEIVAGNLNPKTKFLPGKTNKTFNYSIAAAASAAIVVFSIVFWVDSTGKKGNTIENVFNNGNNQQNNLLSGEDKITVPETDARKETPLNTGEKYENNLTDASAPSHTKKYITITGPQGKPVKISSKAATLIVASGNQDPSSPVWSEKVNKWKDIMKANILAPTTANFLDIVGLTQALKKQDTP